MKHCIQCGNEIPQTAKFCPDCGTAQSGEREVIRYETCTIQWHQPAEMHWKTHYIFWAEAFGPNGKYNAGSSTYFTSLLSDMPRRNAKDTSAAHDELVNKLLKDGWDRIGQGQYWWMETFQRVVQSKKK